LECLLLLGKFGATWPVLIAVPAVLAGGVASICLIFSGIKGIITEWRRPKRRVVTPASPERVVQWIDPSSHTAKVGGQHETLTHQG
jgi:hypothetical protein